MMRALSRPLVSFAALVLVGASLSGSVATAESRSGSSVAPSPTRTAPMTPAAVDLGSPALAAAQLSWSSPALIDRQPPFGHPAGLGSISCPTPTFCVVAGWSGDGIGNIATSADPAGGTDAWKVVYDVDNSSLLSDISCPSTALCVAVDAAGNVVTSTNPTGDASSWTIASIDDRGLNGISCPSTTLCVAVDSGGNVLTSTNPTGGAGAWSTANVDGFYLLSDVSCPSTSLCVAVDIFDNVVTSTNPTGGPGAWSVAQVGSGTHSLLSVSCRSTSLCVAGDEAGNVVTSTDPTGGSATWTTTNVDSGHSVRGISCPAGTSLCVVVDDAGNVVTSTDPTGGGATWTTADVGRPVGLTDVSCPSASLCVVGDGDGYVGASTAPTGGAGGWSFAALGFSTLSGISCPSTTLCVAVDSGGNVLTTADPTGGGSWSFTHVDGSNSTPNGFSALSCPSASLCVAVDDNGNVLTSTSPTGGAGAWTAVDVDGTQRLWAVSCPSASLCVAGDGVGNVLTSTNPTGGAGAWVAAHVDNAPNGLNYLSGISCPSVSLCVAVDGAGAVLISTAPTGGAGAWTRTSVAAAGLLAVSCPSVSMCVAVGYSGTVVTLTGATWASTTVDAGKTLTSVSCPSTTLCVAGDADGAVVSSANPTGGAAAWTTSAVDAGHALSAVFCASETLCVVGDGVGQAMVGTATLDTTPPTVTLGAIPPRYGRSRAASVAFTLTDPDNASTTLHATCTFDAAAPMACSSPFTRSGLVDGTHVLRVQAFDAAGNASTVKSVTWTVDNVAPTALLRTLPAFTLASSLTASWSGTDTLSGIANYDARYMRASYAGGFGAWTYLSTWQHTTALSRTLTGLLAGYDYCVAVRSRDRAGNVSAWTGSRCAARPLDDRALAASTGWTRATSTGYYFSTFTATTGLNRTLTRSGAYIDRIALVATTCARCGKVGVYLNGVLFRTVNLYSATTRRQVLFTLPVFSYRKATVTLKVLTSGKTVQVDGLGLSRT